MSIEPLPNTADGYKELALIGSGATARVYRAETDDGRLIAIKKVEVAAHESFVEMLRREISVWTQLQHENIVGYHTSIAYQQEMWLVSEYMNMGSVLDILKDRFSNGMSEDLTRAVMFQALKGLSYLHSSHVIHRDIKAGNLLVNSEGQVKLADFGVSANLIEGGKERPPVSFTGTPCWMAPEVLEQKDEGYSVKADVWSFGITTIELMEGNPPHAAKSIMKIVVAILQNPPPVLQEDTKASRKLKKLLQVCLVKDPEKRSSAEKLLKHSFFKKSPGPDFVREHLIGDLPDVQQRYAEKQERLREEIRKAEEARQAEEARKAEEENSEGSADESSQ